MASDVSEERMDPKKVFKQLLENFRKNLGSSGQDDGPCHWTAPRPFPSPDANINELSDINKDIINFYKQHVAGVKDFHIASSYVNFILQFLQCELQKQDIKCLQIGDFQAYGSASEGLTAVPDGFDVLVPVQVIGQDGVNALEVVTPQDDSNIPAGSVKWQLIDEVEFPPPKYKTADKKKSLFVIESEGDRFLSCTGFREGVFYPLLDEALKSYHKLAEQCGVDDMRVILQRTAASTDLVIEPNRARLPSKVKFGKITVNILPALTVQPHDDFPIYAVPRARYWKHLSSTDPYNPLWRLTFGQHERHLVDKLVDDSPEDCLVAVIRLVKVLCRLRIREQPESALCYITSYQLKMLLLSVLLESPNMPYPLADLQDCLAFCIRVLLDRMKELKLDSVFFNNDELYDHLPDCDEAMLMGAGKVNVADTITVGIAGSVRQEVQTMLCSQDWGRDIWALVLAKEFREECRQALNNKQYTFVRNVKAKQGVTNQTAEEYDPQKEREKNLNDDSWLIRGLGIMVVLFLLALIVYSTFDEVNFGGREYATEEL